MKFAWIILATVACLSFSSSAEARRYRSVQRNSASASVCSNGRCSTAKSSSVARLVQRSSGSVCSNGGCSSAQPSSATRSVQRSSASASVCSNGVCSIAQSSSVTKTHGHGHGHGHGGGLQAWAEEEASLMAARGTCGHVRSAPAGTFVGVGCGTTCMGQGTLVAEATVNGKTVRVWQR